MAEQGVGQKNLQSLLLPTLLTTLTLAALSVKDFFSVLHFLN
jgi:hypothetical protein